MKKFILSVTFLGFAMCGLLYIDSLAAGTQAPNQTTVQSSADELSIVSTAVASSRTPTRGTTSHPSVTVLQQGNTPVIHTGKGNFPLRTYKPLAATNDPMGDQWWTKKSGLDQVWDAKIGVYQTTVAVIDTGIALNHEEFVGRWAVNSNEQGQTVFEKASQLNCTAGGLTLDKSCNLIDDDYDGIVDNETGSTTKQNPSRLNCTDRGLALDKSCNLIDDDGNGYVDDVRGWDFINNDNNVQAGEINSDGTGTTHATQVAGVLAANGNNARGIAGVNWTTKILPVQAIDDDGYGNTLSVARAIRYAADRNVDVINLSLGGSQEDSYLREAIQYALDKGTVVVAASGNDGCDCISYPARYPEVIAVGAESSAGGTASFSSYGNELDVVAPGDNINTSSWSKTNQGQQYVRGVAGTSFAAPYVSGILSLSKSYQPDASWAELVNLMQAKTDHPGLDATLPFSPKIGSGYVRANSLILRLLTADTPLIRYYFAPFAYGHTLDSNQIYQCEYGDLPTVLLYELVKGSDVQYTINKLGRQQAIDTGWTSKQLWYACVGLKSDKPNMKRTINIKYEFRNQTPDKIISTTSSPHGMKLYVNPDTTVPARASQIVDQPRSLWLDNQTTDLRATANKIVSTAAAEHSLATLVAYNIPVRDCGSYSTGGSNSSVSYRQWIRELAAGIGNRQAIVILEPDALAQINCLSTADQATRYADLSYAVNVLQSQTRAFVYIDAGHSAWVEASIMTARLKLANITQARGFALNVSNFQTSASNIEYGNNIAQQTGKSYVIDTSRNGLGANKEWCNPAGRALGERPTTTLKGQLDAYLWIKVPGESDGTCNGGPPAGEWWDVYARDLIKNAGF